MDISKLNGSEGTWYDIPKWDDGARIRIVRPTPGVVEEMVRRVTTKTYKRGQVYEEQNNELFARLFCDASILGWENIEENGEPMLVTLENKLRLLRDYHVVQAIWQDVVGREVDVREAIREAEIKN